MEHLSEFGKGYSYCLGLFLAHAERKPVGKDYELWFNGAADHLIEFDAISERDIKFKERCIELRLEEATKNDYEYAVQEAKSLLLEYDRKHGVDAIEATWK